MPLRYQFYLVFTIAQAVRFNVFSHIGVSHPSASAKGRSLSRGNSVRPDGNQCSFVSIGMEPHVLLLFSSLHSGLMHAAARSPRATPLVLGIFDALHHHPRDIQPLRHTNGPHV